MGQFKFVTAGESHGKCLTVVVEGMVAGLPLNEEYIAGDLRRRQGGYGRGARMAIEHDRAEILSGVRHGLTIGSPISLQIRNRDWEKWQEVMSVSTIDKEIKIITAPRPAHADLAGAMKYGIKDIRSILERASARETAARVAVGAVARRFLEEFGINIKSHTISIGSHQRSDSAAVDWQRVENSPVRCDDPEAEKKIMTAIDKAKTDGDTLGGIFEVVATGVPVGLGSHVQWCERLDGQIAQAMMSINAVKGVEIGGGFGLALLPGSAAHDEIKPSPDGSSYYWYRPTNRAGGTEGGISNGEAIVVRAAMKPIATLAKPLASIDMTTRQAREAHYERSDVCVVPAAGIIGEAMLAIVLADAVLRKFGGDHLQETLTNYRNYINSITA